MVLCDDACRVGHNLIVAENVPVGRMSIDSLVVTVRVKQVPSFSIEHLGNCVTIDTIGVIDSQGPAANIQEVPGHVIEDSAVLVAPAGSIRQNI